MKHRNYPSYVRVKNKFESHWYALVYAKKWQHTLWIKGKTFVPKWQRKSKYRMHTTRENIGMRLVSSTQYAIYTWPYAKRLFPFLITVKCFDGENYFPVKSKFKSSFSTFFLLKNIEKLPDKWQKKFEII